MGSETRTRLGIAREAVAQEGASGKSWRLKIMEMSEMSSADVR